jgi:hypothetical protein
VPVGVSAIVVPFYLVHDRQRAMMLEETIANAKESVSKLWLETADCRKAPKFLN